MDSSMTRYDLPLIDLFARLRQAGMPIGIDSYLLLAQALQGGFGLPDRAALARLCKTLWIKTTEEERLFDYHFDKIMTQSFSGEVTTANQSSRLKSERPSTPLSEEQFATTQSISTELVLKMEDELQVAKSVLLTASKNDDDSYYNYFIQTDEYFPVTRRQMKQSWRHLRYTIREGAPVELDMEATVNNIGRQGMLLAPVFVARRVNRAQLLLLIDQGGSMVPFHNLSQRLAETALRGGRLGKTDIYYFRNCPVDYLYNDSTYQNGVLIQSVLERLQSNQTQLLIFSDAGAARGGLSLERIDMTRKFLHHCKQYIHHIAWLNPMPRSRWFDTTADELMRLVPMFDFNRQGLDEAIDVLRGRTASHI